MSDSGSDWDPEELSDDDAFLTAFTSAEPTPIEKARRSRERQSVQHDYEPYRSDTLDDGECIDTFADAYEDCVYPKMHVYERRIRLLYIAPRHTTADLVCQLKVFELATAPQYSAISYTWGEPSAKGILLVNDKKLVGRKNCWYALRQARRSQMSEWYWIDSVCINQEDLDEKSFQVAMMGDIFRKASRVLACIGPHMERSEQMIAQLRNLSGQPASSRTFVDHDIEAATVESFQTRAYWQRVWIIQELLVATKIYLLCGDDMIEFDHTVRSLLFGMTEIDSLAAQLMTDLFSHERDGGGLSLYRLLEISRSRLCFEVYDRLYAVLSLIKQPPGIPPLRPDYRLSPMQVAAQAVYHLELAGCPSVYISDRMSRLMEALELESDQDIITSIEDARRWLSKESDFLYQMKARIKLSVRYLTIESPLTDDGVWSAIAWKPGHYPWGKGALRNLAIELSAGASIRDAPSLVPMKSSYVHVSKDDTAGTRFASMNYPVVMAPGIGSPGDVLAVFPMNEIGGQSKTFLLVLRQYQDKYYRIIAHARLTDRHKLCETTLVKDRMPSHQMSAPRFNLYFDPYDLFVYWLLSPQAEYGHRKNGMLWYDHGDNRHVLDPTGSRWSSYAVAREDCDEASPELELEERAVVAQFAKEEEASGSTQSKAPRSAFSEEEGADLAGSIPNVRKRKLSITAGDG